MQSLRILIFGILPILVSGCVAAPMMRTYLAPNPEDGNLAHRGGCSWPRTGRDGLSRTIGDIEIQVFTYYSKRKPLQVRVVLKDPQESARIQADLAGLLIDGTEPLIAPTSFETTTSYPDWVKVLYYKFSALPLDTKGISIHFFPGFLVIEDKPVSLEPFRYEKARKLDVYYESINC